MIKFKLLKLLEGPWMQAMPHLKFKSDGNNKFGLHQIPKFKPAVW